MNDTPKTVMQSADISALMVENVSVEFTPYSDIFTSSPLFLTNKALVAAQSIVIT